MKSLSAKLLLLACIAIISCKSETKEAVENTADKTEEKAKPKKENKPRILAFDGKNSKEGQIPDIKDHSYDISIKLKDLDNSDVFDNSETTPPMPFNIGGWALMKKDADKYFMYNANLNAGTNLEFGSGWHTLRIIAKKEDNRTSFFLDGENVSAKDFFTPLGSSLTLGKGYKSRFWKGEVSQISVKDLTADKLVFDKLGVR